MIYSSSWVVLLLVSTFSWDCRLLFWATYLMEGSIFNWWPATLGSIRCILSIKVVNRSTLTLKHLMMSLFTCFAITNPILIVLVRFLLSCTSSNSPSRVGLGISSLPRLKGMALRAMLSRLYLIRNLWC